MQESWDLDFACHEQGGGRGEGGGREETEGDLHAQLEFYANLPLLSDLGLFRKKSAWSVFEIKIDKNNNIDNLNNTTIKLKHFSF